MADFLDQVREDLKTRGRINQVAEATGLTKKTLRNIRYGESKNPRYNTVERLRAFYSAQKALEKLEHLQAAAYQPRRQQMS